MKFIFFTVTILFCNQIFAQNLPQNDTQIWNDVAVSKTLVKAKDKKGKEFDKISVFVNGTLRFGNNVKNLIDERIGFGFDIKINQYLMLTPSYLYRSNKPKLNSREFESRFRFAATLEKKWTKFSIKDKNLIEYRMRNSKADSTRYRNKFTFSYPILKDKTELFTPFAADEVFYDFSAKQWTRNELSVGISKKFNKNFATEFYYVRQNNRSGTPKDVNAIGINLKFKIN